MRRLLAIALLMTFASPSLLRAATLDEELRSAMSDFNNGQFRDVANRLAPLADQVGEPKTRAAILKYLAAAEWITRKRSRTSDLILRALTLDPELDLDPTGFPIALVEAFNGIRSNLRGKLVVECIPPGGEVEIAGQPPGRCGGPIPVRIGRHAVRVRWGRTSLPNALSVVVPVAQTVKLLARAPAPATPPATVTATPTRTITTTVPTPPKSNKVLGWTLVGSGIAATLAATFLQIVAHNTSLIERSNERAPNYATAQEIEARMKREEIASAVLYVVGGSAIVGGVVTLILDRKRNVPRAAAPSGFRVTLVRDSTGAVVPSLARAWSF